MSAQVLSQTKGVLLAVDDCTGKLLIVYRPVVQALKDLATSQISAWMDVLLQHILFLEFSIAESARVDWLSTWRAALGPEI